MKLRHTVIVTAITLTTLSTPCLVIAADSSTSGTPKPHPTIKALRDEVKDKIQQAKDDLKAKIEEERSAFEDKIKTLKDEKKKTIVENVDTRLNDVNKNQTAIMSKALDELTAHLQKISSNAATAKTNGKNTTTVDAAITTAQKAIATAKDAVASQSAKTYTPQITTESALRQTVGTTVTQLHTDLKTTRLTVIAARTAVVNAAKALVQLGGGKTASPSATPTQ